MEITLNSILTTANVQTFVILAVVWFIFYVWFSSRSKYRGKMPPGPPAWPIVGSLPYLGKDLREPLRKMTPKYGPVFLIHLGGLPMVVLNTYDVIKEAFSQYGQAFAGRPYNHVVQKYMTEGYGVVWEEGKFWQDHRRFTLSVLRDFGLGKPILENKIQAECHAFLDVLGKHANNKPYNPGQLIVTTVYNIINSITMGFRSEHDDQMMAIRLDALQRCFQQVHLSMIIPCFKWLIHILHFDVFGFWACMDRVKITKGELVSEYKKHVDTLQPGVTRDLMDAYLHEMPNRQHEEGNTFTDMQAMGVVGDLFAAGTETTSTTLRWLIVYMLHHPDVQKRVQEEIDENLGQERFPSMRDRLKLPYTEATIAEVLRIATTVPLGVPHQTMEDVEFRGYFIPKNTWVMSNLHAVHREPELWTEPDRFWPDRFLKENEHPTKNKRDFLIPFSVGKRACIGESLAKMELFLFFTAMMQKFSFKLPPGHTLPSLTGTLGTTLMPDNFDVIIEARM